jgi:hypothetical protein
VLLGCEPHPELHQFMDAYAKRMGWGHLYERHDFKTIHAIGDLYGAEGLEEAALHVAVDMRVVTKEDYEATKQLVGKKGRKTPARKGGKARGKA